MQQTSPVFEKIIQLLDEANVDYELKEHPPVYTSEDAAKIRGAKPEEGAKALIFAADKKPILIVVPGDKRVDIKTFRKTFKIKDLRFMKPDEVLELTGLEVGGIPPIGAVMDLPTHADESLFDNEYIEFNAGAHTKSIRMKSADYQTLVDPTLESFIA